MELDGIQTQACKFSRVGLNGKNDSTNKIAQKLASENNLDPDEGGGGGANGEGEGGGGGSGGGGLRGWHHSSRIIRVSRASGGKDRHSKVWTSKGLRDRRVRLSVTTAIQFYDLQDRLGYDQPSKAIEWLIKAASNAISELPSLNTSSFPDTPKQLSDEKKRGTEKMFDSAEVELDPNSNYQQSQSQNQHFSLSKSPCSSNSETSKNSGLSLSKPDVKVNRVKARERARERAAKEKEQNLNNPISQNSFTELLTGGINGGNGDNNDDNNNSHSSPSAHHQNPNIAESDFFSRTRQWPVTQMDYFATAGLLEPSSAVAAAAAATSRSHGFVPGQIQLGNSLIPQFHLSSNENQHQELQHFSFVPNPEHLIPVSAAAAAPGLGGGGDYNLNFTISSSGGLAAAGFNRGTLQSNSSPSSFMPHQYHLQRFASIDGSSPFYIGAPPLMENHHHQFPAGSVDGRLQLCYGDGSRRSSDQKGKGKN